VNDSINFFRHAISLDERRVRFKPRTWYRSTEADKKKGLKTHEMPRSIGHHHADLENPVHALPEYASNAPRVEEVWFAGCHCDVGGGSVENGTRNSLARIPLRWMIRQCFAAKTGIMFHKATFPKVGLDPKTLHPEVRVRDEPVFQDLTKHTIPVLKPLVVKHDRKAVVYTDGGSFVNENEEDLADALSPMYDQLKKKMYWWILEWIPQAIKYQSSKTDLMVSEMVVNRGRGRHIALQTKGVKIHRSVLIRMKAQGLEDGPYFPKANLEVEPEWVD